MCLLEQVSLEALGCFHGVTGFCKPPSLIRMSSISTAFTVGNAKSQVVESKHVINRELWVALQFPIGDDVSAFHPLRSSGPFVVSYTDADETDRRS
jgi:hypothetical protein